MILNIYLAATSALFILMGIFILKRLIGPSERHFLVYVEYQRDDNSIVKSSVLLTDVTGEHFNRKKLIDSMSSQGENEINNLIVINIYEFKNRKDMMDYKYGSEKN